jgi:hypothetical protein
MKKFTLHTAFVATLALTACAESQSCYQLTGTALAQCEAAMAARIAELPRGDDGTDTSNPNGGYQDTNPDNTVVRDDGSEIISEGTLTDVDTDTGVTTTVNTGTVTTTPNETGPSTTNDTNPDTPSDKVESERGTGDTDANNDTGFGAASS